MSQSQFLESADGHATKRRTRPARQKKKKSIPDFSPLFLVSVPFHFLRTAEHNGGRGDFNYGVQSAAGAAGDGAALPAARRPPPPTDKTTVAAELC